MNNNEYKLMWEELKRQVRRDLNQFHFFTTGTASLLFRMQDLENTHLIYKSLKEAGYD